MAALKIHILLATPAVSVAVVAAVLVAVAMAVAADAAEVVAVEVAIAMAVATANAEALAMAAVVAAAVAVVEAVTVAVTIKKFYEHIISFIGLKNFDRFNGTFPCCDLGAQITLLPYFIFFVFFYSNTCGANLTFT